MRVVASCGWLRHAGGRAARVVASCMWSGRVGGRVVHDHGWNALAMCPVTLMAPARTVTGHYPLFHLFIYLVIPIREKDCLDKETC